MSARIDPKWLRVKDYTQAEKTHHDYNRYADKYKESSLYAGDLNDVEVMVDVFKTAREDMKVDKTLSKNKAYSEISFEDDDTLKSYESEKGNLTRTLAEQEKNYKAVLSGATPELSTQKKEVDNKQKAYMKALEEDEVAKTYAAPLKVVLQEINQTEKSIADYKIEQINYEGIDEKLTNQISSLDTEISGYTEQIADLDTKIKGFTNEISNLKGQKRTIKQDSDTKAQDEAFNATIDAQIRNYESKKKIAEGQDAEYERNKTSAKEKRDACDEKQKDVKSKIESLKAQIKTEEDNLSTLKEQKNTLETEIRRCASVSVTAAMTAYNMVKAAYDTLYENSVKTASEKVTATRGKIAQIDGQIAARKQELYVLQKQKEAEEKAKAEEEAIAEDDKNTSAASAANTGATGGGGSTTGSGSAGGSGSVDGVKTFQQLQQAATDAKTDLNTAKDNLFSVFDGLHKDLKQSKETQELSFNTFYETLKREDSAMANTIKGTRDSLIKKEKELAQVNKDVINAKMNADDNSIAIQRVEFDLAELRDSQSKMNDVNESELDADKKKQLNEMKQKVAKAILDKEAELTNLRGGATINSSELELRKSKLETEVSELKNKLKEQMQDAANKYASVVSAQKAYNAATLDYDSIRDALISSQTNDFTTAATKYKEATEAASKEEAKDGAKDYRFASSDTTIKPGTLKGKLAGKESLIESLCQKYGIKDVKFVGAIIGVEHSFGAASSGVGVSCNNYLSYRAAGDTGSKNGNGFGIFSSVDAGLEAGIRNLAAYTKRYNIPEISIEYVDQIGARYCDADWCRTMKNIYSSMA